MAVESSPLTHGQRRYHLGLRTIASRRADLSYAAGRRAPIVDGGDDMDVYSDAKAERTAPTWGGGHASLRAMFWNAGLREITGDRCGDEGSREITGDRRGDEGSREITGDRLLWE